MKIHLSIVLKQCSRVVFEARTVVTSADLKQEKLSYNARRCETTVTVSHRMTRLIQRLHVALNTNNSKYNVIISLMNLHTFTMTLVRNEMYDILAFTELLLKDWQH